MRIKYLDLPKQFDNEDLIETIRRILKKCQFVMGPEVKEFEENFARLCQTQHAIGIKSGTDALFLALKALGIGAGDEVITAPNSFFATTGAIIATSAKPVFVDVTEDYNIDPGLIEPAITPRTKAILPVHLTGNPADMPTIMEIAEKHHLAVIEDACQAVGASVDGRIVGSMGAVGCFSLHPLKNLNVCGDGGVITTNSDQLFGKIMLLRNHGLINRDEVECFGYNSRLDTIQAAVANFVMKNLDTITNKRIKNAQLYDNGLNELSNWVTIPPRKPGVKQVFHTYIVQVKRRSELMEFLMANGIETKIHYPIPIHLQKACRYLNHKEGDFPVCEFQAQSILSLPIHQHLTSPEIEYVVDCIRKFYMV